MQAARESTKHDVRGHIVPTQAHTQLDASYRQLRVWKRKIVNSYLIALGFEASQKRCKAAAGQCGLKAEVCARVGQLAQACQHDPPGFHRNGIGNSA